MRRAESRECGCLRTVWRTSWLVFGVMLLRGIVLLGGHDALAGQVTSGRSYLGARGGSLREVPGWFFNALLAYERAAFLALPVGMVALFLYKRRSDCRQDLLF